jgi:hypothetical protein
VTVKLLWLPGSPLYKLRVFIGPDTQRRVFAGEIHFTPEQAAWFRLFVLQDADSPVTADVFEVGWREPVAV